MSRAYSHCIRFNKRNIQGFFINYEKIRRSKYLLPPNQHTHTHTHPLTHLNHSKWHKTTRTTKAPTKQTKNHFCLSHYELVDCWLCAFNHFVSFHFHFINKYLQFDAACFVVLVPTVAGSSCCPRLGKAETIEMDKNIEPATIDEWPNKIRQKSNIARRNEPK